MDHFRDGHPNLALKAGCLPHRLLEFGHVLINGGAIKWNIRLMAAALVKGVAPGAHNTRLPGFFQLVGDAMQPANHGAIRIQNAAAVNIQGAHQSDRLSIVPDFCDGIDDRSSPQFYLYLSIGFERHQPLFKICILDEGVMVKPRAATIVPTPIAGETVLFGHPIIGIVHGSIVVLQLLYKVGQNRRFNKIYLRGEVHS